MATSQGTTFTGDSTTISTTQTTVSASPIVIPSAAIIQLLSLELIDKYKEIVGTLFGFDDYVNMVLEDITEFETLPDGGSRITKLDQILLNGNHVAMLVLGGEGPSIIDEAV
ncbi:unnamed protein product [Rotaria sordida]|uniref:U6 snRNA-associated Sm-like protein LSm5 n=2 Tax=Rotaria sordida TaxID=392033 RepID=A0A815JU55_9BILA|nr:unnamed protein product [Rotaria sordida]CAF3988163.1 unnamed protein product [Rotaria sordida]CAF4069393.1 unnamed protein product [Rotaria sordida]